MIATVATSHVNWHYLALLLVPSLVVILMMGLTWWSRTRRGGPGSGDGRGGVKARSGGGSASRSGSGRSRAPRGGAKRRRR